MHAARNILRWLLAALLVWAALGALADIRQLYADLLAYRLPILPGLLKLVAIILPWLELLCGLLLLANIRSAGALAWTAALFTVFTICTGQAWLRGLNITCGCLNLSLLGISRGGNIANLLESPGFAFLRALLLGGMAVLLLVTESGSQAPRTE